MSLSRKGQAAFINHLNQCSRIIILDTSNATIWCVTNLLTKKFDFFKLEEFLRMEHFKDWSVDWEALEEELNSKRVSNQLFRSGKADVVLGRKGYKLYFIQVRPRHHQRDL